MFRPQDTPPDQSFSEYAAGSVEPIGLHTPHAAPMQLAFATRGRLPAEYRGDAFVAMRGSWNRKPPSGYEVMRVDFEKGRPVGMKSFVTGFLMKDAASPTGRGQMGRLAGLAQGPDGTLYLSDDENGIIYRIFYQGPGAKKRPVPRFTNSDAGTTKLGLVERAN